MPGEDGARRLVNIHLQCTNSSWKSFTSSCKMSRLSRKSKSAASTLFKRVASGQDWDEQDDIPSRTRELQRQAKNGDQKSDPALGTTRPSAASSREVETKDSLQQMDQQPAAAEIKQTTSISKKSRGRRSKSKVHVAAVTPSQPLVTDPASETLLPETSEVPMKRKRGRPPKNNTKVFGSAARKEDVTKDTLLVPKIVIVKSPVASSVKVMSLRDEVFPSDDTSELSTKPDGEQTVGVNTQAVQTTSCSSKPAVLDDSPSNATDTKVAEQPKRKRKYSIMDSQRKSPKSESGRSYGSSLSTQWQISQPVTIVEKDGMKYVVARPHNPLQIQTAEPVTVSVTESVTESDKSQITTTETNPDARLPMKRKRGRKKKALLPPSPLSDNITKSTEENNISDEKQATGNMKKSPKSSQHPSQQLNQDQFCDIFGLIKTSELKKGGHIHKLHREMGGKLRRTIKPRMAPEMVYRKYTIAKGCTIQGLMEESEESDLPDSQESSPGGSRMFHYEERVRRRPGMKGSPLHLMKSSSMGQRELDFLAQRKLDFHSPMSTAPPKKKEWLKPPSKKKSKLQEFPEEDEKPESSIPVTDVSTTFGDKKRIAKKGPDMWSQRPWMKEHICSTKAKMAVEMKEREAETSGTRRSARQKESQRKEWWHLLRANPDEYESDEKMLPADVEDIEAAGANQSADKAVGISQEDMMEVLHWLKKEDAREKEKPKSKEYLAKVHHDRMVKAWQTRKAKMAASGATAGSAPKSTTCVAKKKKQKKTVADEEKGYVPIFSESTRANIAKQLQPVLSALIKDCSQMVEDKVIELSLPKLLSQPEYTLLGERKEQELEPKYWPVTGYRDKADECITPHMCPICWINDHMYCRNMKRVARDLPPSGGCIHYVPCQHYRQLRTSLVYEYCKGSVGLQDTSTGVCSITIEHGKVVSPENRKPPICGDDLICEETIFESDSDPSAPCSPDGSELLRLHLKVRESQIKQSLGVSKMPVTPYPLEATEVIRKTAVLNDSTCRVEPQDHGAELIIDSTGKTHLPNLNVSTLVESGHNYRNSLPPSMVGENSVRTNRDETKMRIRILPMPHDKLKQRDLIQNKEHRLVKVSRDKSGSKQVIMESADITSTGDQKESVIYVKESMQSSSNTQTGGHTPSSEDKTGNAEVTTIPNSDVLGEIIIQEALRLIAKDKSTPQMLTLTFGHKLFDGTEEASKPKKKKVPTATLR